MRPYPRNQCDFNFVTDLRLNPVPVAFYIEYHPVVAQKAGTWIPRSNVSRPPPFRILDLVGPGAKWGADISMVAPELIKLLLSNKSHLPIPLRNQQCSHRSPSNNVPM
jgi:hypothetical protein